MNDWDINKFLIKQAKLILHFYHACLQAGCVGLACLPACTSVRRFAGRQFTQRRLSVLCVMYVQTVQFSPLQIARLVSADIGYLYYLRYFRYLKTIVSSHLMFQRSIMVICDGNQIDYTKGFWDWGEKGFLSYSVLLEVWKHWNVNLFFQIIGGCYGNSEN